MSGAGVSWESCRAPRCGSQQCQAGAAGVCLSLCCGEPAALLLLSLCSLAGRTPEHVSFPRGKIPSSRCYVVVEFFQTVFGLFCFILIIAQINGLKLFLSVFWGVACNK